jgi:flavorubredoxin
LGVKALTEHFHFEDGILTAVKPGEEIDLGNKKLQFIDARMLHWPDSICSYLPDEKLIFSQDVFGMHLATSQRFADEVDPCILEYEASKYYANIIMPLSHLVPKFAERLKDYPVEIVACDHGPIWRSKEQIEWIIGLYAKWSAMKPVRKAVIVYDTMWESSPVMASAICEGLTAGDIECKIMPLSGSHRSDIVTELLDAGALIVGSPTLNNNIYPSLADLLYYLKGLKPKNLLGGVFSSYGWSGEAHKQLQDFLTEMNIELVGEGVKSRYVPDEKTLKECFDMGTEIATKLKEICSD